ncbi:MAG TPA: ROK family transcriptional regulator [Anaerolineales bacterium]|nr:ROK family transcriptional regulator [Anaerolineales bacterium]
MINKATRSQTKEHNTRLVLQTIYNTAGLSRAEIARITKLTRPTVSSIVEDLIERKLVVETGMGQSFGGGKKPILLEFAKDSQWVMGLHLSSKAFRGVLANLRGEILHTYEIELDDKTPHILLEQLLQLVRTLLLQAERPLLGIGIASPGLVDQETGMILRSVNLNWIEMPIGKILHERFKLPVYVSNDSHLAALAEYQFSHERLSPNLIAINVFSGIGAGIIINGELFVGDHNAAGEIGHVVLDPQGALCGCGNRGCLEMFVNGRLLASLVKSIGQDANSEKMLQEQGGYLGRAIAQVVGLLNIRETVLVSDLADLGSPFLQAVQKGIAVNVLPILASQTHVRYSTLKNSSLLGAVSLVLKSELKIV